MLPTQGLFKDIECPYNDNTCGRPYCHFRHKKKIRSSSQEEEEEPIILDVNEVPTYNPTPKSQLANVRNHIPITYVPDVIVRSERSNRLLTYNKPTYNPTPLSLLTSKKKAIDNKEDDDKYDPEERQVKDKECSDIDRIDNCDKLTNEHCDIVTSDDCNLTDKILKGPSYEVDENRERTCEKKSNDSKSSRSSNHEKSKHKSSKHKSRDKDKKQDDKPKSRTDNKRKSSSSSSRHKSHKSSSSDKRRSEKSSGRSKDKHENKIKEREKKKVMDEDCKKAYKNACEPPIYIPTKKTELIPIDDYSDDDNEMFEDDIEQECLKIFQEYRPETKEIEPIEQVEDEVEPYVPTNKKRIAYQNAQNITPKIVHEKPISVPNPAQVLTNRFKIARMAQSNNEQSNLMVEINKQQLKRKSETTSETLRAKMKPSTSINRHKTKTKTISDHTNQGKSTEPVSLIDSILSTKTPTMYKPGLVSSIDMNKKRKINPVSNMANMLKEKAKVVEIAKQKLTALTKTPSQTTSRGTKRTAHIPDMSLAELPDVIHFDKSKLAVNVRTRFLTMLADETVKLYVCREDAYNRALNEEFKVYERCSALMTYKNSIMLTVNRIRKELQERESSDLGPYESGEGAKDTKDSPFKGKTFYNNVKKYVLTEEDLLENGYPREGTVAGRAAIKSSKYVPKIHLDDNERECARCMKVYVVDKKGYPMYEEECLYHPLRKRTFRGESWYLCCKSSTDTGCATSHTHVSDDFYDSLLDGFQTTMSPEREDDPRSYAVYALDCEMCYTTKGLELTRVTIVDADCKTVYETLVKPLNPIIDYNTRFSGLTKEQMDKTSTSILQVQANILHLCNSKTILIGHSLESDMKALKIIHSNIIDTAIMYPHKFGLPHKRALKTLASEYLMKIIQNDINGHDSAEDALTCMELILYKVKEELKTR